MTGSADALQGAQLSTVDGGCLESVEGTSIKVCVPALQHTATHCNTLQDTATHCNTLQCTAAHCNTLQHTHAYTPQIGKDVWHFRVRATHCNTLQHTATHRITLQHCNTLQHTATHCNTHGNILQHATATHCNILRMDAALDGCLESVKGTSIRVVGAYTTVHCNTLQHTATHCNTLRMDAALDG